jgi:2-polyprenyl-3-methyl-5-hydroxy-6-metoxy-1,4-benzoquinol methylase
LLLTHDLNFTELQGHAFDYILIHAVFTHMPPQDIERCVSNLSKVLNPNGTCFATFNEAEPAILDPIRSKFHYPLAFFEGLAKQYGYNIHVDDSFTGRDRQKVISIRYRHD